MSGKTRVFGIIGNPIGHSLSPIMQNAAFAASFLDSVYVPFAVKPENLEQAVMGLKVLGVCGYNVTIPHKSTIIPYLDILDESAESAGAVNVVKLSEAGLTGYNTDGDGLVDSLATDLGFISGTGLILVIGAGGAARGAIAALCRSGAKRILVCNRSIDKALNLIQEMKYRFHGTQIEVVGLNEVSHDQLASASLLLNTTSLGMNGERIEGINIAYLPDYAKVYDMVYSSAGTPLINEASASGLRAVNGLGMLVAQGERAFEIWTGQKPPVGVMRNVLNIL